MARVNVIFDGVSRGAVAAAQQTRVAIDGVSTSADHSTGKVSRWGGTLGALAKGGAITAAIGGAALLTKGLFASVDAAKEAQSAQTRLKSALENAGVSWDKHSAAIDQAIQKTSKLAGLDDEELSDAFAKLVRTTGDVTKATEGMNLAADIARARNISLEQATGVVEKAMIGQTRGLKAVGVELEKGMTSTEALERAQIKFAGSAQKASGDAQVAQDKLGVAFENLQEKVGTRLVPVITRLTLKLVDLVDWTERNWPKIDATIDASMKVIVPIIDTMVDRIKAIATTITGVVHVIQGIKDGDWSLVWQGMKEVVTGTIANIVASFVALPAKILGALSAKAFSGLSAIGVWIKNAVLSGLEGIGNGVLSMIQGAINSAIGLLNSAIGAYNAIPIAPNIPKVSPVGGSSSGGGGAADYPGRRALGGPVEAGFPYLVGEHGPELMVPSAAGRIVPNHRLPASVPAAAEMSLTIVVQGNTLLGSDSAMAAELARRVEPELRRLISYQADR